MNLSDLDKVRTLATERQKLYEIVADIRSIASFDYKVRGQTHTLAVGTIGYDALVRIRQAILDEISIEIRRVEAQLHSLGVSTTSIKLVDDLDGT